MGINQGPISLDQKYTQGTGHIFLTGIQALVRLPMARIRPPGFIRGARALASRVRARWRRRSGVPSGAASPVNQRSAPISGKSERAVKETVSSCASMKLSRVWTSRVFISDSQRWMRRLGGQGYPTLGLVQGDKVTPLSASSFLGEPAAFARQIQAVMGG